MGTTEEHYYLISKPFVTTTTDPTILPTAYPTYLSIPIQTTKYNQMTTENGQHTTTSSMNVNENICNYMIEYDTYSNLYLTVIENKCYHVGSNGLKYVCSNDAFIEMMWFSDCIGQS